MVQTSPSDSNILFTRNVLEELEVTEETPLSVIFTGVFLVTLTCLIWSYILPILKNYITVLVKLFFSGHMVISSQSCSCLNVLMFWLVKSMIIYVDCGIKKSWCDVVPSFHFFKLNFQIFLSCVNNRDVVLLCNPTVVDVWWYIWWVPMSQRCSSEFFTPGWCQLYS